MGGLYVPAPPGSGISPPAGDIGGTAAAPTVTGLHLPSPLMVSQGGTGSGTAAGAASALAVIPASAKGAAGGVAALDASGSLSTVPLIDKGGQVCNVKAYGAKGDGTTDDTAAIGSALAAVSGGGTVYLPAGTYLVSGALTLSTGQTIAGAGLNATIINQTSTTADTLAMTDQRYITVRDLMLQGPGSGTGRGIAFLKSAAALASLRIETVRVNGFGGRGIQLGTPITSVLRNVRVEACGGDFFYLDSGTSLTLDSCYAVGAAGMGTGINGFQLHAMSYTTLNACACDTIVGSGSGGGAGYLVNGGRAITFNSCGNESSALGWKVTTSADAVVFNACEVYANTTTGWLVTSTSTNITFNSPKEMNPNGATSSINVATGCTAVVINPSVTTTFTANGTTYQITSAGAGTH